MLRFRAGRLMMRDGVGSSEAGQPMYDLWCSNA